MRKLAVMMLVMLGAAAHADECNDLAKRFAADAQSLKVGELDQLMSCISHQEQLKAQGPDLAPQVASARISDPANLADPVSQPVGP